MGDFADLFGHCLCVIMHNFIMYQGFVINLSKLQQKKRNVRAHCVAEPDANQRMKFFRRPDTNPTQRKNA